MRATQREVWVDNVKIIACILVVLGHFFQSMVGADIMNDNGIYRWFNQTIYMFHVPLFFICSGYLYQRYSRVEHIGSWGKNILKKLIALGIPYFVFSIVTWLLKAIFSSSVNDEAGGLIESLFISPLSPYWYLYALFFVFMVTPTAKNKGVMMIELIVALMLKTITIMGFSLPIQAVMYIFNNAIWFVLGMCMAEFDIPTMNLKKTQISAGIIMISVFSALSVFVYVNNIHFRGMSFILGIMACAGITELMLGICRDNKTNRFFSAAVKYTMPVFLMHTIFAAGIRAVLMKIGIDNLFIHMTVGIAASFAGPIIAAEIMHRVKALDFFLYPTKYIRIK